MDEEFDRALVNKALELIGEAGWRHFSVATAARKAGLSLDRARARFPFREAVLLRFGLLIDESSLAEAPSDGPSRDRLFDIVMRRIDALQAHRGGVSALLRELPTQPVLTLMLASADLRSMAWLLEGAGIGIASGTYEIVGLPPVKVEMRS